MYYSIEPKMDVESSQDKSSSVMEAPDFSPSFWFLFGDRGRIQNREGHVGRDPILSPTEKCVRQIQVVKVVMSHRNFIHSFIHFIHSFIEISFIHLKKMHLKRYLMEFFNEVF